MPKRRRQPPKFRHAVALDVGRLRRALRRLVASQPLSELERPVVLHLLADVTDMLRQLADDGDVDLSPSPHLVARVASKGARA